MRKIPRLTDTQLTLLSAASQRPDGMVLPLPDTIQAKGKMLERCLARLLSLRLVEECPVRSREQSWREDFDRGLTGLRIADTGREFLGITGSADVTDAGAKASPRQGGRDRRGDARATDRQDVPQQKTRSAAATRPGTKQARLVQLLSRRGGASLASLARTLGWQPHTVRAALSGLRRKGYGIVTGKDDRGGSVYRIAESEERTRDDA